MTSSHTWPTNKSTRTPHRTREHRRSSSKTHTTLDPEIMLVCSGLVSKLFYPSTIFRHYFSSNSSSAVLEISKFEETVFYNHLSKGSIDEVEKTTCFKNDQPREWYLPYHPVNWAVNHPKKTLKCYRPSQTLPMP